MLQFLVLGALFLVVGLVLDSIIGLLSGRLGEAFRRRDWLPRLLDRIAGTIFAGLALRIVLSERRP